MKRTGLKPPTLDQVRAWQARPRKPLRVDPTAVAAWRLRSRRPLPRIGARAQRERAALALGRATVIARSGGWCEGPEVLGVHPSHRHCAQHVHHVLSRARGGDHDPSNLLNVCAALHAHVHQNPAWASEAGLLGSRP